MAFSNPIIMWMAGMTPQKGHDADEIVSHRSYNLNIAINQMPSEKDRLALQQWAITATAYFLQVIGAAAVVYQQANYWKQPYHTSALTGEAWVQELIDGHSNRISNKLEMQLHVFLAFVANLRLICGFETSKHGVTVQEQAAIFLYACITGLSVCHLGEWFQRSNELYQCKHSAQF